MIDMMKEIAIIVMMEVTRMNVLNLCSQSKIIKNK